MAECYLWIIYDNVWLLANYLFDNILICKVNAKSVIRYSRCECDVGWWSKLTEGFNILNLRDIFNRVKNDCLVFFWKLYVCCGVCESFGVVGLRSGRWSVEKVGFGGIHILDMRWGVEVLGTWCNNGYR